MLFKDFFNPSETFDVEGLASRINFLLRDTISHQNILILSEDRLSDQNIMPFLCDTIGNNFFPINIIRIDRKSGAFNGVPAIISYLLGKRRNSYLSFLKAKWYSLNLIGRLIFSSILFSFFLLTHLLTLAISGLTSNFSIFLFLKTAFSYDLLLFQVILFSFSQFFPVFLYYIYWRYSLPSGKNDSENKITYYCDLYSRNDYKYLFNIFDRNLRKSYGPNIIAIEELDTLKDFDLSFLKHAASHYEKYNIRTSILAHGKYSPQMRVLFSSVFQNVNYILYQSDIITDDTGIILNTYSYPKDDPTFIICDSIRSKHKSRQFNIWLLLCIISSTKYFIRRGFDQDLLNELFLDIINDLQILFKSLYGFNISTIDKNNIKNIVRSLFEINEFTKISHIEEDKRFYIDHMIASCINEISEENEKILSSIILFIYFLKQLKYSKNNQAYLNEISFTIKKLINLVKEIGISEDIRQYVNNLTIEAMKIIGLSYWGQLQHDLGYLYVMTRSSQEDSINDNDILAINRIIIYGFSYDNQSYYEKYRINRINEHYNPISYFFLTIGKLTNSEINEFLSEKPDIIKERSKRILFAWRHSFLTTRNEFIPFIVKSIFEESPVEGIDYFYDPKQSGGFTLTNNIAINHLFCYNLLQMDNNFLTLWSNIVESCLNLYPSLLVSDSKWEIVWTHFTLIICLTEMILYLSNKTSRKEYDSKGLCVNISYNEISGKYKTLLNKIFSFLDYDELKTQGKRIPTSILNYIRDQLHAFRFEFNLTNLDAFSNIATIYIIIYKLGIRHIDSFSTSELDEFNRDLSQLNSSIPTIMRSTISIEADIFEFWLKSHIDRNTALDIIDRFLHDLRLICPFESMMADISHTLIHRLRLSSKREHIRYSIILRFPRAHQLIGNDNQYNQLEIAEFFLLLASDLHNIGKISAAKASYNIAKNHFNLYADELLEDYYVIECLIVCIECDLFPLQRAQNRKYISSILKDDKYYVSNGYGITELTIKALEEFKKEDFSIISNAVKNNIMYDDWYQGFKWAIAVLILIKRLEEDNYPAEYLNCLNSIFNRLIKSDQSYVPSEQLINPLMVLRDRIESNDSAEHSNLSKSIDTYLGNLFKKQANIIHINAISKWMLENHYGKIIDSYYRLLKYYIRQDITIETEHKIAEWTKIEDSSERQERGIEIIKIYYSNRKQMLWDMLFLIDVLNQWALSSKNKQIENQLKITWTNLGANELNSMLDQIQLSKSIPTWIKDIIAKHKYD